MSTASCLWNVDNFLLIQSVAFQYFRYFYRIAIFFYWFSSWHPLFKASGSGLWYLIFIYSNVLEIKSLSLSHFRIIVNYDIHVKSVVQPSKRHVNWYINLSEAIFVYWVCLNLIRCLLHTKKKVLKQGSGNQNYVDVFDSTWFRLT